MFGPEAFFRNQARRRRGFRREFVRPLLFVLGAMAPWTGCQQEAKLGPPADSGLPGYASCNTSGECIALVQGCCGTCQAPTLSDVTGVNSSQQAAFRAATCTDPNPACPKCAQPREPNLIAICESDQCTPIDVRQDSISVCVTDDDCMLRYPECCESCEAQPDELIAIAKRDAGLYRAEVCAPGQACPPCEPAYPANASTRCAEDGHCRVVIAASP